MATVTRPGSFVRVHCDSAVEFLEMLNPIVGLFRQRAATGVFIFRGQSSSQYRLLPAAFRDGVELVSPPGYRRAPLATMKAQCLAELQTIRRFFDIASRHGIRIPEDSQRLRKELDEWVLRLTYRDFEPFLWPPVEFRAVIALAQHYRVPTRALDWSWSSFVAAYFAIEPLARCQSRSGDACVWVFNYTIREIDDVLADLTPGDRPVALFTTSGADNVNLRAQQALFMLWEQKVSSAKAEFEATPYEELLTQTTPTADVRDGLFQVTVAANEAQNVMALLAGAGVTAGALFPGLWGVASEFHEQKLTHDVPLAPQTGTVAAVEESIVEILMKGA